MFVLNGFIVLNVDNLDDMTQINDQNEVGIFEPEKNGHNEASTNGHNEAKYF